jgi:hypothetical protein
MSDLLTLVPVPELLPLGGRLVPISELTLASVARLEAWCRQRWDSPFERLRPSLDAMGEDERYLALWDAADAVEASWPAFGEDRFTDELLTPAGRLAFLDAAIGQSDPDWRPEDTRRLVLDAAARGAEGFAAEFGRIWRAAWGVEPSREVERLMHGGEPERGRRYPVAKWYADAVAVAPMTPRQFAELTVSQVLAILARGRRQDGSRPVRPGEDVRATLRARRQRYLDAKARVDAGRAAASGGAGPG